MNLQACSICSHPIKSPGQLICGQCQKKLPAFVSSFIPFVYQPPFDWLISQFKFHDNLTAGKTLARLFCEQWNKMDLEKPEVILPVPLHNKRLQQRGFNQSLLLAREISKHLDIPVDNQLVSRKQHTKVQHELKGKERRKNMRGAFELNGETTFRHVVILDDIVTSGSTVNEMALVLKKAGVERVEVWAIARTERKP